MDIEDLKQRLLAGERRALARAITLIESTRDDHRAMSRDLISGLYGAGDAIRLGLSGTPGVGKSTFIEAFGMMLAERGLKIAVLAVDPSSARTGGSILGDKTRMEQLTRHPNAFIRPSPSQAALGGVARRTREAIILCEAAGYDLVIVETVGVGQSETMVADMTDLFLLLLAPAGGDELQGVKRGIMEIADLIVVNKADGELKSTAVRTAADYRGALRLMRSRPQDPDTIPDAITVSAVEGDGLKDTWDRLSSLDTWRREHGWRDHSRAEQSQKWLSFEIDEGLKIRFRENATVSNAMEDLRAKVAKGDMAPEAAAETLLGLFKP